MHLTTRTQAEAMYLVGVDCAAQPHRFGLALGKLENGRVRVLEVEANSSRVVEILARWAERGPVIFALDAPLGWPVALGRALASHEAGAFLTDPADRLFSRSTDLFVRQKTGKRPLEVGADRIARTAAGTLRVLDALRRATGLPLPLAWSPGIPSVPSVVEVYPAASLRAHGLSERGYKGSKQGHRDARVLLAAQVLAKLDSDVVPEELVVSDDVLDAVICLLAAQDFIERRVFEPTDPAIAEKEGWIWFGDAERCGGRG